MTDEYPVHRAAKLFPMMRGSELKELADDIRKRAAVTLCMVSAASLTCPPFDAMAAAGSSPRRPVDAWPPNPGRSPD